MKQSNEKVKLVQTRDGKNFLLPFILITSLFFLWGFAHSILDVLNKHFQDALGITRTRSALIQAVVYGGYFLMALPAGNIIRRYGYRAGVLTGCKKRSRLLQQKRRCCYSSDVAKLMFSS